MTAPLSFSSQGERERERERENSSVHSTLYYMLFLSTVTYIHQRLLDSTGVKYLYSSILYTSTLHFNSEANIVVAYNIAYIDHL